MLEETVYTIKLTEKQKKFAWLVAFDLTLIDAYKQAYETHSSNKVIGISANALMKNPKIQRAIKKNKFELSELRALAFEQQKFHVHLANELMDLSQTVEDEKMRLQILQMLFEVSRKLMHDKDKSVYAASC